VGIIALCFITEFALFEAEERSGVELDMKPTNLWAYVLVIGLVLIVTGIGQTVVRRRASRDS
jgi:hypothetical protein